MINIILALAHQMERKALRSVVVRNPGVEVMNEATNICEVLSLLESGICPDLVLLDAELANEDEIFLLETLTSNFSFTKVLIINTNADERAIKVAFTLGVKGYLLKDCSTDELALAITEVASGKEMLCSSLGLRFLKKDCLSEVNQKKDERSIELSHRELEILSLIAEGYTNAEIADKIFVSRRTVEGHRLNLINKLGVKNSAQLVKVACQNGLIAAA
jgi:DNA-binding NarL/FixJ family response regulator